MSDSNKKQHFHSRKDAIAVIENQISELKIFLKNKAKLR